MNDVLIVYNTMCIGGSTTSLLSILNLIDYSKYRIDLMLAINSGELVDMIPREVNLLEPAWPNNLVERKKRSVRSIYTRIKGGVIAKYKGNRIIKDQFMSYENARMSRRLDKEYDIAIAFLENFPLNYVGEYVKAKKKIAWIHLDYKGAGFYPKADVKWLKNFDQIVLVSDECKESFDKSFPQYANKSCVIPNILSTAYVRERAISEETFGVDPTKINLVSVCRITFAHKGLDRAVEAFRRLKEIGEEQKFHWYVIGEGADFDKMKHMIEEYQLEHCITLLGKRLNPLPIEKKMDLFLLPSRYEGKPMAVTEAQMLGIPPVVTEYASAPGQIKNRVDGIIIPNNDEAVFEYLHQLAHNSDEIKRMTENLEKEDFDNVGDFEMICRLMTKEEEADE